MAIISHVSLFSWKNLESLGDLHRLRLLLDALPDEPLMRKLEDVRGRGRDDYPVRAMWNSVLAGVVFQHPSIESLRRELLRNGQLREMCGFSPAPGEKAVPPAWAYTRFFRRLFSCQEQVDCLFHDLVERLRKVLPDFGEYLAIDGKAISSHGKSRKKDDDSGGKDGRREQDADWGKKQYKGTRKDGSTWEKVTSWFGFKIHLLSDATYELPVGYTVTKASRHDVKESPVLLKTARELHPGLIGDCEALIGDKGYDDVKLIQSLWDEDEIKPVIDIRNLWKDGEATKRVDVTKNVVFDYKGTVYCHCPQTGERRRMPLGGFEKDRACLKYRCPAKQYGVHCKGQDRCSVKGSVRIPLSEERRVFTPLARSSYRWARMYKKRTSVERINSRLDVSFGMEHHFIRGQKKMAFRCGLALTVMLAMALGRIKEQQKEKLRSLVQPAAA